MDLLKFIEIVAGCLICAGYEKRDAYHVTKQKIISVMLFPYDEINETTAHDFAHDILTHKI